MDVNTLKPKLGRWLTIDEIRGLLSELPDHMVHQVPVNRKLLENASHFVEQRVGWWEHEDWNGFLAGLWEQGFQVTEETHAPIGSLLEIFKGYYHRGAFDTITDKRRKPAKPRKPRTRKKTTATRSRA